MNLVQLQAQLDAFRDHYNQHRPHRAFEGHTPAATFAASPKAAPAGRTDSGHYRLRYDHVGSDGKISFRRAGRMHHLGIGADHRSKRVLILADEHHHRRPPRHRRNSRHLPDRPSQDLLAQPTTRARPMAGLSLNVIYVATQMTPMSRLITERRIGDSNSRFVPCEWPLLPRNSAVFGMSSF